MHSRAESEHPDLSDRGDVEILPRLTLAVRPFRANRHDRADREAEKSGAV
jgi:hypothetical protein